MTPLNEKVFEQIKKVLKDATRTRDNVSAIYMEEDYDWDGLAIEIHNAIQGELK